MLLKSMKLKNFRQFKGEQIITFSTDPEKNVTIIMGENGSGKTSLAQAFTWCFYGSTDFNEKDVLNTLVAMNMTPNDKEKVFVEILLQHQGRDYTIKSEQNYSKKFNGDVSENGQRSFSIAYKAEDGTQKFIDGLKTNEKMKEIIPKELIKYFFFDGEHIEVMGKQLSRGKGTEFAEAVKSILGLKAFTSALKHLKTVKSSFNKQYDAKGNASLENYNTRIDTLINEIEKIEIRLSDIEREKEYLTQITENLNREILQNKSSEELAKRRQSLERQKNSLITIQKSRISDLLRLFNKNASSYFATKMMFDALTQIEEANITDKSVKNVNADTINQIIERGKCICGAEVCTGNEAYNTLNALRDFIPPKHIGSAINEFRKECNSKALSVVNVYDSFA
ncbi:MAG: AAA family ATPase, partial [Oscillospiraceae bacterium]|nr:AAA family ATPase [Oscillospiraceae bacterium]